MPVFTIGRAAKLYGLHRSTLYEAVSKGRISTGVDGKGQRVIDLSEMIRVYGEPPGRPDTKPDTPTPSPDTHQTDTLGPLLDELRLLREEVRELRQAMLRIEHKPPPARPTNTTSSGQGVKSFADLVARFNYGDDTDNKQG